MVNWKDIHPNFTKRLQKKWQEKGFDYDQAEKWINALALLSSSKWTLEIDNDLDFCAWSRDKKRLGAEQINDDSIGELWEEYDNSLLWRNIHPNLTEELQKEWENRDFNYEDCKSWIEFGCHPHEAELACYLSKCQKNKLDKNIEKVRTEYSNWKKLGFDLKTIMSWKRQDFTPELIQPWLEIGLTDGYFCSWLKNSKQLTPEQVKGNEQQLREEYNNVSLITKQWLEKYYPDKEMEGVFETRVIYLNQQLEGVLDCSEYKNLQIIFISTSVDRNKFEIKKGSYWGGETKIIPCIPAQNYLDQFYPKRKRMFFWKDRKEIDRKEIKKLNISSKDLEGNLDLSDFQNLEILDFSHNYLTNLNNCGKLRIIWCCYNQFTTLNLSNSEQLEELSCYNNCLTQIIYPPNLEKITELDIRNNNFSSQNLSIFNSFRNLEKLYIGNWDKNKINQNIYNHFYGSLEPLKDLSKLRVLDISNTDIDGGWEYLPDTLSSIYYDTNLRLDCKLVQNKEQLEQELWRDIHEDFVSNKRINNLLDNLLRKDWLEAGFGKEETKKLFEEWNKNIELIGPQDREFLNWFLNFKKLDLEWAQENEEELRDLRNNYHNFGTCSECQQPNTSYNWCQSCNAKHFEDEFSKWTSGDPNIDAFIQKCQLEATSPWNVLEWIPYEQFRDIKHIANGGFGKVEGAKWKKGSIGNWNNESGEWKRNTDHDYDENAKRGNFSKRNLGYKEVALKTLSNSQNITNEFLQEITLYKRFRTELSNMVPCYGISRDEKGNYIMVMEYMKEGNLREYLKKNPYQLGEVYDALSKDEKFHLLKQITQGLKDIHRKKLVHRDFHSGNIIVDNQAKSNVIVRNIVFRITDLGLCKPVDEVNNQVYGVIPYVAPEVLQGKPYTQKSDIYSLGIIMYEIISGLPPFINIEYDVDLALQICQGGRPQFPSQVKYPQLLVDLITKCWDNEPNNRPTAKEVSEIVGGWFAENRWRRNDKRGKNELKTNTILYQQYKKVEEYNKTLPDEIRYPNYQSPSRVVWHSKKIDTEKINELVKKLQEPEETSSNLIKITEQIKEIGVKLEELKNILDDELSEPVEKFIKAKKKLIKDKKNKEVKIEARKLGKQLEEKGLSEEKIDEIIRYCENLVELERQLEQEQLQTNIEVPTKK